MRLSVRIVIPSIIALASQAHREARSREGPPRDHLQHASLTCCVSQYRASNFVLDSKCQVSYTDVFCFLEEPVI